MKQGDYLFVYGTLRVGESADLSKNMLLDFISEDSINGLIYDLGSFPGVKTSPGHFDAGQPAVLGDVFRIRDESITAQLDAYEGYPSLYDRIETETSGGRHVWVYVFQHPVLDDTRIVSGNWFDSPASWTGQFKNITPPSPVSV